MATPITNQATLTYQFGGSTESVVSNIATTLLEGPLTAAKSALTAFYKPGDEITYLLTMTNNGATALTNVQIADNLGTYTLPGPVSATPLSYVGPAQLYVNGAFVSPLAATVTANGVSFPVGTLQPGANAMVIFVARINNYAPLEVGSTITNNSSFTADGVTDPVTASYTMTVEEFADIRILKSMSPNPVTDGSTLTYGFTLYHYGNTDVTDVVLSDTFTPAPSTLSVSVGGVPVAASEYDYASGVLTLPGAAATLSMALSAADFVQDPATGLVSVAPTSVEVTVSGTI